MVIPPELAAMIDAGRKAIEQQAAKEQEAIAAENAELARLRDEHLNKLPVWMREYAYCDGGHEVIVYIELPGCAPIRVKSKSWSGYYGEIVVIDPLSIDFDGEADEWYVGIAMRDCSTIEEAVAVAADLGESYWQMQTEAERRNLHHIKPASTAEQPPVAPTLSTNATTEPDPLARIADALEMIAFRLTEGVIYVRRADQI